MVRSGWQIALSSDIGLKSLVGTCYTARIATIDRVLIGCAGAPKHIGGVMLFDRRQLQAETYAPTLGMFLRFITSIYWTETSRMDGLGVHTYRIVEFRHFRGCVWVSSLYWLFYETKV